MQIRGYPIRLDLDVCLVFSANPEDYTNRGRIVTPLKDRIGRVIRTHYPETMDEGIPSRSKTPGWIGDGDGSASGVKVEMPRVYVGDRGRSRPARPHPARTSAQARVYRCAPASPTPRPSSAMPSGGDSHRGEAGGAADLRFELSGRQLPRQNRDDAGRGGRGGGQADQIADGRSREERLQPRRRMRMIRDHRRAIQGQSHLPRGR